MWLEVLFCGLANFEAWRWRDERGRLHEPADRAAFVDKQSLFPVPAPQRLCISTYIDSIDTGYKRIAVQATWRRQMIKRTLRL